MGNSQSFQDIEKKYGQKGIDYVAGKCQERRIYSKIGASINNLKNQATTHQNDDIEFLRQQVKVLEKALQDGKNQIELKKKGAVQEAEGKLRKPIQDFSGFNEQKKKIEVLQKNVVQKYTTERNKIQEKVTDEVNKHKTVKSSQGLRIPEYDRHPDNYRRSIEDECANKYPQKVKQAEDSDLGKKLTWENYRQNFISILNREQARKDTEAAANKIKDNITGGSRPICC